MKHIKTILLTSVLTFGVFSMAFYSSCSKSDKCEQIVCKNNGTCEDGVCICPLEYEGPNCGTATTKKFLGEYNTVDNCPVSGETKTYKLVIREGASVNEVFVYNLYDLSKEPDYLLKADLTTKTELTIKGQTLPDGRIYSGNIQFEDDGMLTMSFKILENGEVKEACNSTLTKK